MSETAPWRVDDSAPQGDAPPDLMSEEGASGWQPSASPPPAATPPPESPTRAPAGGSGGSGRRRRPALLAAALALTAAVAGASGVAVGAAIESSHTSATSSALPAVSSSSAARLDPKSFAAVAASVVPSVVSINVSGSGQSDTGSGVIVRSDGYVLTNNHVVAAAAGGGSVQVTFNDGSTAPARIVGADQPSDLAVLKVSKTGLKAASLGRSADVHVGDPVLAVGSPLGLSGTVTSGIVSALNRPVNTTDQQSNPFQGPSTPTVINAIQTDAAINPGNSGGPLVNAQGEVIGINSAIASLGSSLGGQSGNIGVGFAIPIDQARSIAGQLMSSGHAAHPMLGISLADATTSTGQSQPLVQAVQSGSPAAKAGLKAGDVIVAVDGQRVGSSDAVIAAIRTHNPGDRIRLTVLRNGQQVTMTATLAEASTSQG